MNHSVYVCVNIPFYYDHITLLYIIRSLAVRLLYLESKTNASVLTIWSQMLVSKEKKVIPNYGVIHSLRDSLQ